jgi:hypothetical protein
MTVIAYREGVLASDRQAERNGLIGGVSKIMRVHDGFMAGAGNSCQIRELIHWYESGADPKDFPESQRGDEFSPVLLLTRDGLSVFEKTPYPVPVEEAFYAIGCGMKYATTAMHLGMGARDAVRVACELDSGCGRGIDSVCVEDLQ